MVERMAYDAWGKRRFVNGNADTTDSIVGLTTDRANVTLSTEHEMLDELGIHLETCANEASAAALLAASINYPLRGCVTWKSIVGTNVASDALSNLASAGVTGCTVPRTRIWRRRDFQ